MLSPLQRLRKLVARTAFALPPLHVAHTAPSHPSTAAMGEVSCGSDEFDAADHFISDLEWNSSFGGLLQSLARLSVAHASDWSRLKMHALSCVSEMTPKTALRCLLVFSRQGVCAKTDAMRLQEAIASSCIARHTRSEREENVACPTLLSSDMLEVHDVVLLLHALCVLQVGVSAKLLPIVQASLPEVVRRCPAQMLARLTYALYKLFRKTELADELVCTLLLRARETQLLGLTLSERVYVIWSLTKLTERYSTNLLLLGELLLSACGVSSAADSSSGGAWQNAITLDVIRGKTSSSNQLAPRDVVLLLYVLSSIATCTSGGGAARFGSVFYDQRRAALQQLREAGVENPESQLPLVDPLLLQTLVRQRYPKGPAHLLSDLKPVYDALCDRITSSLLSCELASLSVASQLLGLIVRSGWVFCSTQAQLAVHLLSRCLLCHGRDAVFLGEAADHQGGLTMLCDVPTLSDVERQHLVKLRLSTSASLLAAIRKSPSSLPCVSSRIRTSLHETELTVLMLSLETCRDVFANCTATSVAIVSGTDTPDNLSFYAFYKSLLEMKFLGSLQKASPRNVVRLVHSATQAGVISSAAVAEVCVNQLVGAAGSSEKARRTCASHLLSYLKDHSLDLFTDAAESSTAKFRMFEVLQRIATCDDLDRTVLIDELVKGLDRRCVSPSVEKDLVEELLASLSRGSRPSSAEESADGLPWGMKEAAKEELSLLWNSLAARAAKLRPPNGSPASPSLTSSLLWLSKRIAAYAASDAPLNSQCQLEDVENALVVMSRLGIRQDRSRHRLCDLWHDTATEAEVGIQEALVWLRLQYYLRLPSRTWWASFPALRAPLSSALSLALPVTQSVVTLNALLYVGCSDASDGGIVSQLASRVLHASLSAQRAALPTALVTELALSSWRGTPHNAALRQLLCAIAEALFGELQQVTDGPTAVGPVASLDLLAAASTVLLIKTHRYHGPAVQPSALSSDFESRLIAEICRVSRLLFSVDGTFSMTKLQSSLNEYEVGKNASMIGLRWCNVGGCNTVHPCAKVAMIAQVLQSSLAADASKLFGAQMWRQATKHLEKLATILVAAPALVAPPAASSAGPMMTLDATSATPSSFVPFYLACAEDVVAENNAIMALTSMLMHLGASAQSLDTLLTKWKKRSVLALTALNRLDDGGGDLTSVLSMAEAILVSGKRRAVVTECIAAAVESSCDNSGVQLAQVSPHFLWCALELVSREAEKVTLTHARAGGVSLLLWNALELRLPSAGFTCSVLARLLQLAPTAEAAAVCCRVLAVSNPATNMTPAERDATATMVASHPHASSADVQLVVAALGGA